MSGAGRVLVVGKSVRGGFTLVEVMLVLLIIGVIAAFVVPNLLGSQEEAQISETKNKIQQIEAALDKYRMRYGSYPEGEGVELLRRLVSATDDLSDEEREKYPKDGFFSIRVNPDQFFKDAWGRDVYYSNPGKNNTDRFDLYSAGPNKIEGDEDDIVNWSR